MQSSHVDNDPVPGREHFLDGRLAYASASHLAPVCQPSPRQPSWSSVPSPPLHLADSPWPMTGHDPQRSGRGSLVGPRRGRWLRDLRLPPLERTITGLTVQQDRTLCLVTSHEVLFVRPEGTIVSGALPFPPRRQRLSPATALADGRWVSTLGSRVLVWSMAAESVALEQVEVGDVPLDDSCVSPGFSRGHVVLGAITGEVLTFDGSAVARVGSGTFGYDVLPPSSLADGALVIAGYAGRGLCCVDIDGTPRWRLAGAAVDMMPSIHTAGVVAVGSLNEKRSCLVSTEGERLGTYEEPALWADQGTDGWVAWSRLALAGVSLTGALRWRHPWPAEERGSWAQRHPIVDGEGWAYALHKEGLLAVGPAGDVRFTLRLKSASAMALVAPGELLVATPESLLWIG
ncbi:MAG: hypothetical protein EOO70_00115 [Myxococcaceae bacterium]|nr:MAG: hypothetical protein EOO70_00115 [Myxococcaceae bacterium]